MSVWGRILVCAGCAALGMILGVSAMVARPDLLRRIERRLGLKDSRQPWFYSQIIAFHRRVDACVPDGSVLFIGDSFIQGLCVSEITKDGINYGIGGDTTEGLLARLPIYGSMPRASAVVFAVGDNDLRRGRSEIEVVTNYHKIVAQLPKTMPVFFCSLMKCVDTPEHAEINRGIDSLNRSLKELCAAEPRCHLVDLNTAFNDERGCLRREFADDDGVHLNGTGYRLCIEKLREAFGTVLTAPNK